MASTNAKEMSRMGSEASDTTMALLKELSLLKALDGESGRNDPSGEVHKQRARRRQEITEQIKSLAELGSVATIASVRNNKMHDE
jgi:hypothetical protein